MNFWWKTKINLKFFFELTLCKSLLRLTENWTKFPTTLCYQVIFPACRLWGLHSKIGIFYLYSSGGRTIIEYANEVGLLCAIASFILQWNMVKIMCFLIACAILNSLASFAIAWVVNCLKRRWRPPKLDDTHKRPHSLLLTLWDKINSQKVTYIYRLQKFLLSIVFRIQMSKSCQKMP